ncbi:cholesterol 24-hydroxylase-like [Lytechinus variegatus]|uniref:cholesterol 24-hydroxylase-like n=1 Tax=Lytechinus variegatus TaxID=7654 RepID=UPI001BB26D63|nr:cholesterol 24-hydroxylase-like [Lytechinus variegatus]
MGMFLVIVGYVLALLATMLGIGLVVFVISILRTEHRYRDFPGPKRDSFLLGNILSIMGTKETLGQPFGMLMYTLTLEHGPVFWMRIFSRAHIIASVPEVVKELLLNSRHIKPLRFYHHFQYMFGTRFMGTGLVSEINHEKWFHKRAIINPAFRRKYLIGMMEKFNSESENLCEHLVSKADGQTEVEMLDEFNNVTLDVIANVAFSMPTGAIGDPSCPFPAAFNACLRGMQTMIEQPFHMYDPRSKTRKVRNESREAVNFVRETGRQHIKERIEARQRGDHVPHDILNVILDCANDLVDDKDFTMENMVDEFTTIFAAGQETTSDLLSFTIQQLGRNPEVAKKLQAEVDEVLGQKSYIEYEDLAKLEYMMMVFKETLRLYPPVIGTTRVTAHPIKYKDLTIPAGVEVSVLHSVMARMEEYFDDPLLFNPDRFKPREDDKLPRHIYAFFPFSIGQRSCIGQQFALIEARVILGKLLQRFEFHFNQSQRTVILDELTLKPLDKCKNYLTLRV